MAEPVNFEDILKTELRWPQQGDQLVKASKDWAKNAVIATNSDTRAVMMTRGYKKGADLMVNSARNSNFDRDCLVYPIIFNYRHFLELSLKHLIATYGPTFGAEPNWNCHDLTTLWTQFEKILVGYGTDESETTDKIVKNIVAQFAKIDSRSDSYRYAVDTNGNPIPVAVSKLDLDILKDVMDGVAGFFDGCDGYFSKLMNV